MRCVALRKSLGFASMMFGTNVWLSDWRDVDTVIVRVGAWLRANDYALQVGIGVEGIPVPHAAE